MSLVKFHIPLNIYSLQHAWRIRCQRVAAQTCMKPSLFKEGIPRNCVFHMPFHSGACTQKTTNGGRISFISEYIHNHIFKCPYICILEDNVLKGKRKKKKERKMIPFYETAGSFGMWVQGEILSLPPFNPEEHSTVINQNNQGLLSSRPSPEHVTTCYSRQHPCINS